MKEPAHMTATTMTPYREFRPTCFDPAGLCLPDRQNWLVAPVSRTRDSGPLTESNFSCFLEERGGEGESVEVHRFGHWGPGWFEIVLIDPDAADVMKRAMKMEGTLSNYPVLDEEDFSRREWEGAEEAWKRLNMRDRILAMAKGKGSIFAARRNEMPDEALDYCRPE